MKSIKTVSYRRHTQRKWKKNIPVPLIAIEGLHLTKNYDINHGDKVSVVYEPEQIIISLSKKLNK